MRTSEPRRHGRCGRFSRWLLALAITGTPVPFHPMHCHAEISHPVTRLLDMRPRILHDRNGPAPAYVTDGSTIAGAVAAPAPPSMLAMRVGGDRRYGGVTLASGPPCRIDTYERALMTIREFEGKEDSADVARLTEFSDTLMLRGNPDTAIMLLHGALAASRRLFGRDNHSDVARCMNRLGRAHLDRGDYATAESYFDTALAICRKLYGKIDRSEHAAAYTGRARSRLAQRKFTRVGNEFALALEMQKRLHPGVDHPAVAEALADLGHYYADRGNYIRAESLLLDAYDMCRRLFGAGDHPLYARCMHYLAAYYLDRGDLERGADLLMRSHEMLWRLYAGRNHLHLAEGLIAVGRIREARGDLAGAQRALQGGLAMLESLYGRRNHVVLAEAIGAMGRFHEDHGSVDQARAYVEKSVKMYGALDAEGDHPGLANSLCDLAILNCYRRRFNEGDSLFNLAAAMCARLNERGDQIDLLLSMERIARFAERFDLTDRAFAANRDLLKMLTRVARASALFESEPQQLRLQSWLAGPSHSLMRFFLHQGAASDLYDAVLWSKGRVLSAVEWRNRVLMELGCRNDSTAMMWRRLQEIRGLLSDTRGAADTGGFDDWLAQRERLLAEAERMEGTLTRRSADIMKSHSRAGWQGIKQSLTAQEAVVEFLAVPEEDTELGRGATSYYALVLRRKDRSPVLVPLCDESSIVQIVQYPVDSRESNSYIHDAHRRSRLYRTVWSPLEGLLNGVRTVYISPDGLLNQVAFGPLEDRHHEMLLKRYELRYLFSSRDLLPARVIDTAAPVTRRYAAVFGGVRYDADSAAIDSAIERRRRLASLDSVSVEQSPQLLDLESGQLDHVDLERAGLKRDASVGKPLAPLAGTRREAEQVAELLASHGYAADTFIDLDATEEAFTRLRSPSVLHVATHGYFFSNPRTPPGDSVHAQREGGVGMIRCDENPLLRSGLLLAGVDRVWTLRAPPVGIGDGIVTAYDIAHMDLSGTDLVVLSACETGRGDINGSEGVFGLKRAFRAAGARTVMMSLWKVPDAQTRDLMELFYINWLTKGMGKHEALTEAQRTMARTYGDPYYWAAFVLVGR